MSTFTLGNLLMFGGPDNHGTHHLSHSLLDTTKFSLRLVPGRLNDNCDEAMPEIAVGG